VQERFEAEMAKDPTQFDTHPIKLRWWTVASDRTAGKPTRIARGIFQALTKGTAASWFDGVYVAVYRADAEQNTVADLVLEVPKETFPEPEGFGEAMLVGEYLANGACALDLDDLGIAYPKAPPFVRRNGVPYAP
jgi:hypothetical protein